MASGNTSLLRGSETEPVTETKFGSHPAQLRKQCGITVS